jgi:hypothetical protein
MGSGSLAAMGVFEDGFKPDMTKEEGCKLVRDAIAAGIFNDLGSGSNIDLCVITADGVDYMRPCVFLLARARPYIYATASCGVLVSRGLLRTEHWCHANSRTPSHYVFWGSWLRFELANKKGERSNIYSYKPGTTAVLHTEVEVIAADVEPIDGGAAAAAPMDE